MALACAIASSEKLCEQMGHELVLIGRRKKNDWWAEKKKCRLIGWLADKWVGWPLNRFIRFGFDRSGSVRFGSVRFSSVWFDLVCTVWFESILMGGETKWLLLFDSVRSTVRFGRYYGWRLRVERGA